MIPSRTRQARRPPRTVSPADIDVALAAALERESHRYLSALRAARTGQRGPVHRLRIAIRRLTAAIELAQGVKADSRWSKIERQLRRPFKACGRLRDMQVVKRSLRRLCLLGQVPERLWEQARERVKRQKLRLLHCLAGLHPRKTHGKVRDLAIKIKGAQRDSPGGQSPAHTRRAVMKVLEHSKREMRDACRGARIVDSSSLHAARIAIKVYRYQLEVASFLHMPWCRAELPGLRLLQKDLGSISDLTLLIRELERFVGKYPKAPRGLANARRSLGRERRRCFASVCAIRDKGYTGT